MSLLIFSRQPKEFIVPYSKRHHTIFCKSSKSIFPQTPNNTFTTFTHTQRFLRRGYLTTRVLFNLPPPPPPPPPFISTPLARWRKQKPQKQALFSGDLCLIVSKYMWQAGTFTSLVYMYSRNSPVFFLRLIYYSFNDGAFLVVSVLSANLMVKFLNWNGNLQTEWTEFPYCLRTHGRG